LAAAVLEELTAAVARLRSGGDGLRWTAPASWHITLQFLGETDPERCDSLIAALRSVHRPPVPVALDKLGCFERPGVLFAAVQPTPLLLSLQQCVESATAVCGFLPDSRPYQPHITLARSREHRAGLKQLETKLQAQPRFSGFVASEFLLYESFLGPGGARYEARRRFSLDAPG